jgi:hypothetical protein
LLFTFTIINNLKILFRAKCQQLMPANLDTQEAGMRRNGV